MGRQVKKHELLLACYRARRTKYVDIRASILRLTNLHFQANLGRRGHLGQLFVDDDKGVRQAWLV